MGAWDMFLQAIFTVIQWFHSLVGDWGLAILMITLVFRILIYPITRKQFKTTYKMQKLQPQIKVINEKYADDPQRKQQEMQKLYQEAKFNPLSGCLPTILQMPIFMALFRVLRDLSTEKFDNGVNGPYTFFGLDITVSAKDVFADAGILATLPYALLLLLFASSMLVPLLINRQAENQKQMRIMMIIMCGFMLFVGWQSNAGVLLYWDLSSYIGVAQQFASRALLKRKDDKQEEAIIDVTPVKVEVDRKERKARPRKKN